ncbi:NADH dehydrogenase subunit 4 (mitochondrion) [Chironomus tepperi]|uniref:NADH-ubiquinone oxidoreductase chain 4 n=1 Tax=Chironomus tepperi TaxID=113505 RepID=G8J8H2_9DIPT|nr:NADH dehydrogenase subunit 4 [Chironomus tepperi]AET13090.1 NADH dehydrogenase subunit 4 [Chironomus tepperi]
MLKIFFFLLFMTPICFMKNMFWMVQNMIFFCFFLCLFMSFNLSLFNSVMIFGMDVLSFGLILLSFWICALMIMSSSGVYFSKLNFNYFLFNVIFLLFMLLLTFSCMNLFLFYVFFESSLIPTLFLILGWGYQPERLQAGLYLLFYTLFASLPLLMALFYIMNNFYSLNFLFLKEFNIDNFLLYLFLVFAFLVKMPMFLVHLWLPKAHVEAPVSGSMILAGVLLKLGGYGLIRIFSIIINISMKLNIFWIVLSLVGGFLVSLICLRQIDLKSLVAYSSVAHMSLVIGGLMVLLSWGWGFSYSLMIAHGLCSSGLFYLVNLTYERLGSRSLLINKGMLSFMPSVAMWWFLLCSTNMAAPPSLNLMGEIGLINSVLGWSQISMFLLMLVSFFSAAYTLYLYSFSQHGKFNNGNYSFSFAVNREYLVLMLHWLPVNLLFLKSELMVFFL